MLKSKFKKKRLNAVNSCSYSTTEMQRHAFKIDAMNALKKFFLSISIFYINNNNMLDFLDISIIYFLYLSFLISFFFELFIV
jgi:hypothetical protein